MAVFDGAVFDSAVFDTDGDAPPVIIPAQTPAGAVQGGRKKRRWVHIGERLYHADEDETAELLDAYVARKEGQEVELPKVESKPPRKRRSEPRKIDVVVPEVAYEKWDWQPEYVRYARMYDDYMARMLLEAIRRRAEEENDIEVLLLH